MGRTKQVGRCTLNKTGELVSSVFVACKFKTVRLIVIATVYKPIAMVDIKWYWQHRQEGLADKTSCCPVEIIQKLGFSNLGATDFFFSNTKAA